MLVALAKLNRTPVWSMPPLKWVLKPVIVAAVPVMFTTTSEPAGALIDRYRVADEERWRPLEDVQRPGWCPPGRGHPRSRSASSR